MNRFASARHLLWISCLVAPAAHANVLGCGTYALTGKLTWNNAGHYQVQLNPRTMNSREFLLLGGPAKDKAEWQQRHVRAVVYFPEPIDGQNTPYAYLQELALSESRQDSVTFLHAETCGDDSKFRK